MNLTKKEKFSFGFGALGKDAICCFVGNFLMFYFTDVLFLDWLLITLIIDLANLERGYWLEHF